MRCVLYACGSCMYVCMHVRIDVRMYAIVLYVFAYVCMYGVGCLFVVMDVSALRYDTHHHD